MMFTMPTPELIWMSDRADFWNASQISEETYLIPTLETYLIPTHPIDFSQFTGKRILFLVHGYNNRGQEARETYKTVCTRMSNLKGADGQPLYDLIIGYFWPGYDNLALYALAERNVKSPKLNNRLSAMLTTLAAEASAFDVLAHSMGNRLVLEALSHATPSTTPTIRNFYSFAAAINDDAIEKDHEYGSALNLCERIYIFHSDADVALNSYQVVEHHETLGSDEKIELAQMPSNVQFIDCTNFLQGDHSAYFKDVAAPLYIFIQNQQIQPTLTAAPQEWQLLTNGSVKQGDFVLGRLEKFKYLVESAAARIAP